MVKSGLIIIVSTIVFLATTTEALRCWRCSSDATNGAYCSDPFDQTLLDETQRRYGYIECSQNSNTNFQGGINPFNQQNNPYNQNYQVIPACKKLKQLVNGKVVINRSCVLQNINAERDSCISQTNGPSYITTEFCQTCVTDGCNSGTQYGPIAMLVAIPTAILIAMKIFV